MTDSDPSESPDQPTASSTTTVTTTATATTDTDSETEADHDDHDTTAADGADNPTTTVTTTMKAPAAKSSVSTDSTTVTTPMPSSQPSSPADDTDAESAGDIDTHAATATTPEYCPYDADTLRAKSDPFLFTTLPESVGATLNDDAAVQACVNTAVEFYADQLDRDAHSDARAYLRDERGITPETINEKRLGYAPASNQLITHLEQEGFHRLTIARTGLARVSVLNHIFMCDPDADDDCTHRSRNDDGSLGETWFDDRLDMLARAIAHEVVPPAAVDLEAVYEYASATDDFRLADTWNGRITIPYPSTDGNDYQYLIARETDATDDNLSGKYAKQTRNRAWINNDVIVEPIYGLETVEENDTLLSTEGIMDAILAHQAGYPCVSPATTTYNPFQKELLYEQAERTSEVVIINDSEPSLQGYMTGLGTAADLLTEGYTTRIGTIPLPDGRDEYDLADFLATHDADALSPIIDDATQPFTFPLLVVEDAPRLLAAHRADVACLPADLKVSGTLLTALTEQAATADDVVVVTPPDPTSTERGNALEVASKLIRADVDADVSAIDPGTKTTQTILEEVAAGTTTLTDALEGRQSPHDVPKEDLPSKTRIVDPDPESTTADTAATGDGLQSPTDDTSTSESGNQTQLWDLELTAGAAFAPDVGRYEAHPLGHYKGDKSNYFSVTNQGGFKVHDFKANNGQGHTYTAITWLAVRCGARNPENPTGRFTNAYALTPAETWQVWKHAKESYDVPLPDDDPVPTKALWHLAEKHELASPEDIPSSYDDPKLPKDAYNEALRLIRDEYGLHPGRRTLG